MEQIEIKKEYIDNYGETIHEFREYNIKHENKDYILRIEIYNNSINFILSFKDKLDYIYKTNWSFSSLSNELELNANIYSQSKPFLDLFDHINEKKNFFINIDNNNYILIIKFMNILEKKYEIKFNKNHMSTNDKFNLIFNQLELLKDYDNRIEKSIIEKINIRINELNNKLDLKETEIKDIIDKKDKIINEMNIKLSEQEKKIEELENNIISYNKENEKNLEIIHPNECDKKIICIKKPNVNPYIYKKMRKHEPFNINTYKQRILKNNNMNNLNINKNYDINKRYTYTNDDEFIINYPQKENNNEYEITNEYQLNNINENRGSKSIERYNIKKNNIYSNKNKLMSNHKKNSVEKNNKSIEKSRGGVFRFNIFKSYDINEYNNGFLFQRDLKKDKDDKDLDNKIENDDKDKYKKIIKEFRDEYSISKESCSDEELLQVLKECDFDMAKAFDSLFGE